MKKFIFVLLVVPLFLSAKEEDVAEHVWEGNLALPISQQPGPLLGFGQNILDKGDIQAYAYINTLVGNRRLNAEVSPSILYGITENLSFFFEVPFAVEFFDNLRLSPTAVLHEERRGVEDLLFQFEYAFYNKEMPTYANQATIVAAITAPTGEIRIPPPTGFGAPSFFLGATASHVDPVWYYYLSSGATLPTTRNHTKVGNLYFYQGGGGINIAYWPKEWIFTAMFEFAGTYFSRNKVNGAIDLNSGAHLLLMGPSLWWSTQQLIIQGGFSFPAYQKFFGNQNNVNYYFALNIGWKFNT